jgi:hypothetical protein
MTAIWGPLGWLTLHSVATSYSEQPSMEEKQLMVTWLDLFRDTITCPSCRDHFTDMLAAYRRNYPSMLDSRQNFAIASFRMHNAVNRRLQKPIYSSVEECMTTLKNIIKTRSAYDYRVSYNNHILRHWKTQQDTAGIVALKKVYEMKKIEIEYISDRDTKFNVTIQPDIVVLPSDVMTTQKKSTETQTPRFGRIPTSGLVLGAGGFRLRK